MSDILRTSELVARFDEVYQLIEAFSGRAVTDANLSTETTDTTDTPR
jgi:hypothetical protein